LRGRAAAIISVSLPLEMGGAALTVSTFDHHRGRRLEPHSRQVKLHGELVPIAPGIHWHDGWAGGGSEHLWGEPVKLTEGVCLHQDVDHIPLLVALASSVNVPRYAMISIDFLYLSDSIMPDVDIDLHEG